MAAAHSVVATGRDARKIAAAVGDHDNLLTFALDVTLLQQRLNDLGTGIRVVDGRDGVGGGRHSWTGPPGRRYGHAEPAH